MDRQSVFFCFADPPGFSGQKAATELLIRGLEERGWRTLRLPQPVFDRRGGGVRAVLRFAAGLLRSWARSVRLLCARGARLNVNLGQTPVALVRDCVPLACGWAGLGPGKVSISLHGSLFMQWRDNAAQARAFRSLVRLAGAVTVLGERQRARLLAWGVPPGKVHVVVNSCSLPALGAAELEGKQARPGALELLHLSSLIDTKGYPVFLAALDLLAPDPGWRAVLCGQVVASEHAAGRQSPAEAEAWIAARVAALNLRPGVACRWIPGARGEDKARLFRAAQIFVLPTTYAVEAQPIVLLEAMAAGCAIVTTRVGEIETILDPSCAVLLDEASAETVAEALVRLADPALRSELARAAHARYRERFELPKHLDAWERLLAGSAAP